MSCGKERLGGPAAYLTQVSPSRRDGQESSAAYFIGQGDKRPRVSGMCGIQKKLGAEQCGHVDLDSDTRGSVQKPRWPKQCRGGGCHSLQEDTYFTSMVPEDEVAPGTLSLPVLGGPSC